MHKRLFFNVLYGITMYSACLRAGENSMIERETIMRKIALFVCAAYGSFYSAGCSAVQTAT